MEKIYTNTFSKNENLKPKDETIRFLLNYSKALSVINYNKLKFEVHLN